MYLELFIRGTLETRDIFPAKWPLSDRSQEHHPVPALFSPSTPDLFVSFSEQQLTLYNIAPKRPFGLCLNMGPPRMPTLQASFSLIAKPMRCFCKRVALQFPVFNCLFSGFVS